MSEASAPFNPQDSSSNDSSIWQELASAAAEGATPDVAAVMQHFDLSDIFDASELDEASFEELLELASAIEPSSPNQPTDSSSSSPAVSPASVSANVSSIATWSQNLVEQNATPEFADLVGLVQELNRCNGVLLDRVSQLEEALECSQSALQAEVGRTQEAQPACTTQDWAAIQEQITTLFNQLEFAHQTNQRQQILIETLTGQLESSQERVAQLEREAALLQQRYTEQAQLLTKSEGTSRDLQSRLQRQQRYTLQFKAALEKSLEVPTPQYESGPIAAESQVQEFAEAPFLPKAKRIQPWSAQTSGNSPWMKLQHLALSTEVASTASELTDSVQTTQLNLPSFNLPLLQISSTKADQIESDSALNKQAQHLSDDPALKEHLDQAVKPLADMLAEALLGQTAAQSSLAQPAQTPLTQADPLPMSAADELLAATMADAEDALWQDLARLIDVSTEDVVKASLSGDIQAFESIDFTALQASQEVNKSSYPASIDQSEPDASAAAPLVRRINQVSAQSTEADAPQAPTPELIPALASSSWPSPVVYPLRPNKKRQSLAMVDLPMFPQT